MLVPSESPPEDSLVLKEDWVAFQQEISMKEGVQIQRQNNLSCVVELICLDTGNRRLSLPGFGFREVSGKLTQTKILLEEYGK